MVQVGAGAFLHGRGNFLHARRSGVRGKNLPSGYKTIHQGREATDDDQKLRRTHPGFPLPRYSVGAEFPEACNLAPRVGRMPDT
jgi:hypothetical protein